MGTKNTDNKETNSNDSEYYYLGRKILSQQIFNKKEEIPFDAYHQANAYLLDMGYSSGSLSGARRQNIAIRKGVYDLPEKWRHLNEKAVAKIQD